MSSTNENAPASSNGLEIAVIGMAGRFPSAGNIEAFWQLLQEGREGLTLLSQDELEQAGVAPELSSHPGYVRKRGVISRKREFDAALLGYTAQDAATMDPQFGVFHEVAWEALENAGYHSTKYDGLIGLYAGATGNHAWINRVMASGATMAGYYNVTSLTDSGFLCTRVAHRLDLTGPALTTNTACSTSLVNIHLACQGLITGDCDIALAGGVSVSIDNGGYLYQENMVLSPDGSCRPFDAAANGTAAGEGCGVLVLKRLEDALADNDTVVAVIKGSAVNSDGQRKVGFTAPSSEGQARVIRSALDRAEVGEETIGYIEAHGTATQLGDPIEIAALKTVFHSVAPASCAIGSVKSNIGHLGEAAGVAGAIKAILSLRHHAIPPSLNFETPSPLAGLDSGPFVVNTQLRAWHARGELPLRAGVSSFGIGGTNAHVIFEEATVAPLSGPGRTDNLVLLSANTPSALEAVERNLIAHAQAFPRSNIADICYTLHVGRKDLPYRKAFVVTRTQELAARATSQGLFAAEGRLEKAEPRLCFLFPGQGTQYRGMGSELYQREPVFRDCMDKCLASARRSSQLDFRGHLFAEVDTDEPLASTELAQPLLFFFEYSLAVLLQHWGLRPHAYLGHSVGEYVAACLAGVFSLDDAIAIVIERGRLVQSLPAGAMLAVALDEAHVLPMLDSRLTMAAVNSHQRVVVSGDVAAIEDLQRQLGAQGAGCVRLQTSHAFHSPHLDPVLERFRLALQRVILRAPGAAFLSNVTGNWITDDEAMSPDYWVRHLRETVRFSDCVDTLCRDDAHVLVEVGPGHSLTDLAMQQNATGVRKRCVTLVPHARERVAGSDGTRLFEGLCQLFVLGVSLDWSRFHEGRLRRRIPLPTYPFEGRCHYPPQLLGPPVAAQQHVGGTAAVAAMAHVAQVSAAAAPDDDDASVESRLLAIWKKYLGLEVIAVDEDVFDLGVDSLLSIRVITEIRETFDADISLDTIFVLRTVAQQATEIERKIGAHDAAAIPPLRSFGNRGPAPLSTSQRRLWVISQLESDQTTYNAGSCMFVKRTDHAALERAFRTIIQRHWILRTTYTDIDGEPMQQVHETFDFRLGHADISHLDPAQRESEGERLWQQALRSLIDLRKDLMLRAQLVKYDDDKDLLLVTLHHICSDNWSNNALMSELGALYDAYLAGREDPLPPLPVQYIDYALWQNEWLRNAVLAQQIPYWRKTLAGIPHVHNLPLDRPRPKYQSYRGKLHTTRIDASVLGGITRLGQQNGATLFMTMQAAFSVFVARYSGESDIVLGFPVANRLHRELEGLIGFFVNPLVLRSDLSGNPTFTQFLAQTRQRLVEAYANSHVPFATLIDELKPPRSMSYEPIIQIQLIYLDQSQEQGARGATRADQENVVHADMHVPYSRYDLTLYFSIADGLLTLNWEYATDLFDSATIHRMADNFETLLRSIVATPDRAIRSLTLVADAGMGHLPHDSDARGIVPAAQAQQSSSADADEPARGDDSFQFSLFYFASDDGGRAADKYRLLIEGARFADRNRFEAVWTPERHFDAFGGAYPNPAITAAALAAMTSRVKLRAGSCVLPLHNPVRVAEDWSVIDNLSGGRVGIGFAAGYSPNDFTLAPANFESRRDVLIRDVQTVKALWRGEGVMLPNGKGEMAEIRIRPCPIQPELPVWVTTVGSEDAFRHAGRMGDNILTHLMGQSLEELARKVAIYRTERATAGHPGSGTITLLVHTFIAENEQVIFDSVKEPFKQYLLSSVGTPQSIAKSLGLGGPGADGGGEGRNNDIDTITEFAFRRYYQSNALLGTAEHCLPLVQAIRQAGVNEVACLIDFGVDRELVLESLPLLARLRDLAISDSTPGTEEVVSPLAATADPVIDAAEPAPSDRQEPDSTQCIHRIFEQCAAAGPDAVALVYEGEQLTYGELNARANRIAHHLIAEHAAAPELRIGLCVGRSAEMIVGLLAILKTGAAYVPIEPDLPHSRIRHMLLDAGIDVVLTRAADDAALKQTVARCVPIDRPEAFQASPDSDPQTAVTSHNAAYLIYTSGSTGLPKGVLVEHRSVVNLRDVLVATTQAGWPVRARVALNASLAFDASLQGILQLLSGHCLHVIPQDIRPDGGKLLRFLKAHRIHAFDITPSQLNVLLAAGLLSDQEYQPVSVWVGGEPINATVWDLLRNSPTTRFFNVYGPTECTVNATIGLIGDLDATPHIGQAIANTHIHLLDEYGQPVPRGSVGEIHIGGAGVARGYLNQPELTAKRFVADPYSRSPQARLYRTGDLARMLDDGNLAYLGRNDLQIKLRGFRVELGEIERHLVAHDEVREAAVLAQGEEGARFLVAHVVPARATFDASALQIELKRALTEVLPAYMVPQAMMFMEGLPLNANGKLDRQLLLQESFARPSDDYLAPRTETERTLAAIWGELMGLGDISVRANFFELGGQSLVAIRVVNEISRRMEVELETRYIFEYSTIETLAECIDNTRWSLASQSGEQAELSDEEVVMEI